MGQALIKEIQPRFTDMDLYGHVNNVRIMEYFDLGKTDMYLYVFQRPGFWTERTLMVVSSKADYMHQTVIDNPLYVETFVEKIGNKSVTIHHRLHDRKTGLVNAECVSVLVAFDTDAQCSIRVPDEWRERLSEFMIDE